MVLKSVCKSHIGCFGYGNSYWGNEVFGVSSYSGLIIDHLIIGVILVEKMDELNNI
jgi:hypothetical protein